MTSPIVLTGVTKLVSYGVCVIDIDGNIVADKNDISQTGDTLLVGGGEQPSSTTITISSSGSVRGFGNRSTTSGDSDFTVNGIRFVCRNGTITAFDSPASTIVVGGVATNFGTINTTAHNIHIGQTVNAAANGSASTAPTVSRKGVVIANDAEKSRVRYQLGNNCSIASISMKGLGTCLVAGKFLSNTLTANVAGSGVIPLPAKTFSHLTLAVAGNGIIKGDPDTKTQTISAAVAGNGDIKNMTVLNGGTLAVAGNGSIWIRADNPGLLTRSTVGGGKISIVKTATNDTDTDSDASAPTRSTEIAPKHKKRTADITIGSVIKRGKK